MSLSKVLYALVTLVCWKKLAWALLSIRSQQREHYLHLWALALRRDEMVLGKSRLNLTSSVEVERPSWRLLKLDFLLCNFCAAKKDTWYFCKHKSIDSGLVQEGLKCCNNIFRRVWAPAASINWPPSLFSLQYKSRAELNCDLFDLPSTPWILCATFCAAKILWA